VLARQHSGEPYQLVSMDMHMQMRDGIAATRRLRAAGCDVPIVALTANSMSGDRERCLEAGCDAYLSKPICRAALLDVAARAVH